MVEVISGQMPQQIRWPPRRHQQAAQRKDILVTAMPALRLLVHKSACKNHYKILVTHGDSPPVRGTVPLCDASEKKDFTFTRKLLKDTMISVNPENRIPTVWQAVGITKKSDLWLTDTRCRKGRKNLLISCRFQKYFVPLQPLWRKQMHFTVQLEKMQMPSWRKASPIPREMSIG